MTSGSSRWFTDSGIENYMNDAPVDIGIQNNFGNPKSPVKGVALPVLGVVSFIDHTWSNRFTSSAGYSMVNIQNSDADLPAAFHQGHYALANLLFYPAKSIMVGSEFQYGRRLNFSDGFNTNDYRVQFSFKYDWSKALAFHRSDRFRHSRLMEGAHVPQQNLYKRSCRHSRGGDFHFFFRVRAGQESRARLASG